MVQGRVNTHSKSTDAIDGLEVIDGGLLGYLLLLDASIHPLFAVAGLELIDHLVAEIAWEIVQGICDEGRDGVRIGHDSKKKGGPRKFPVASPNLQLKTNLRR
jgi:hypothetical protein